jgi:hypothetical protein
MAKISRVAPAIPAIPADGSAEPASGETLPGMPPTTSSVGCVSTLLVTLILLAGFTVWFLSCLALYLAISNR